MQKRDFFHDNSPHLLVCGDVNQNLFITIWAIILALGSLYLMIKIGTSFAKARQGEKSAASVLVFPVYFRFLQASCICLLIRAVMIRFLSHQTIYYGIIYLTGENAVNAALREGIIVFLIQDSAGGNALKRTYKFGILWGLWFGLFGLGSFVDYEFLHWGPHYLGSTFAYYLIHDISCISFYIWSLLYMYSFSIKDIISGKRRSTRISNQHVWYSIWPLVIYIAFLIGDIMGRYQVPQNGCLTLCTQLVYYILWPFATYYTLKQDSLYWRQAALPNHSKEEDHRTMLLKHETPGNKTSQIARQSLLEEYAKQQLEELQGRDKLIDFSRLQVGSLLGTGGSASVFKGKLDGKVTVAVKRMYCKTLTRDEIQEYLREVLIAEQLRHPNIIELYGVSVILPYIALVMEYAERGTLYKLLPEVRALPFIQKLRMAIDFASAVDHLHSQQPPIIHFDLKSLNLLVDKDWRVKLADFGESRRLNRGEELNTPTLIKGTVHWLAPEAFRFHQYTEKTDIYSAGMILYEMISGTVPYHGVPLKAIPGFVVSGKRPPIPNTCPPDFKDIIERCWHADPTKRPTARELLMELEQLLELESRKVKKPRRSKRADGPWWASLGSDDDYDSDDNGRATFVSESSLEELEPPQPPVKNITPGNNNNMVMNNNQATNVESIYV